MFEKVFKNLKGIKRANSYLLTTYMYLCQHFNVRLWLNANVTAE